ncbi:MAG: archease [Candidatus Schekmanbacteria bacterium]|nr:archease [Candidatus Schekmanbacteria bacterium]
MKTPNFEIISTTADMGFIAWGESPSDLFVHAAEALSQIITVSQKVHPNESVSVKIEAHDWPELAVNWLSEILYWQEVAGMFFSRFEITDFAEYHFQARLWGEEFDPTRHEILHEVKAITYHGLELLQEESGRWRLKIIVDI